MNQFGFLFTFYHQKYCIEIHRKAAEYSFNRCLISFPGKLSLNVNIEEHAMMHLKMNYPKL